MDQDQDAVLTGTPRLDGVRVLVLFGAIPLLGQERGNIEVFRAMGEIGLKSKFITNGQWGRELIQPELTRLGLEWTTARFGPRLGRNLFGFDFFKFLFGVVHTNWILWREVRRWRPTHIHAMNWVYVLHTSPLVFCLRTPLIYRLGDPPPQTTFLHRSLWRMICRRSSVVVCISEFIRAELGRSPGAPRKTKVIYNHLPHRRPGLAPVPAPSVTGAMRLIYMGQLTAEKGVPILIEAVRLCLARGRNITLWLVGDYSWQNPLANSLISTIREDKLAERIQFLGYQENVPGLLGESDLHVCPSVWGEPLGNVVMEAKAQAIPSVVFPDGGLPEMIEHKVDGFICSGKTVDALVEGICWFLDHPEERKKAGRAARTSLEEKFGPERFKREWAQVFLATAKE